MPKSSNKAASHTIKWNPTLTPREVWENSEWERIKKFICDNRDADTPYPIPGLVLNFHSDNGRIKMRLDVKDTKPCFGEAVKKQWPILRRWRARLTAFEKRPRWETLPHPAQILIARSKRGRECLEWMKQSDPELGKFADNNRGNGLSPGALSRELNETIESWLKSVAANSKTENRGMRFSDSVGLLMTVGHSKTREEAVSECEDLLAALRRKEDPFCRGRAKFCLPVTQEMVRKRLAYWLS